MKESIGNAVIPVVRKNGADGEITVKWRTIDKSAVSGRDFSGGEGVLTFKHTEVRQAEGHFEAEFFFFWITLFSKLSQKSAFFFLNFLPLTSASLA